MEPVSTKYNRGYLKMIIGPMFSGKSTEIIRQIRLLRCISKKLLIIKPIIDIRYDNNKIVSHNYEGESCISIKTLKEIEESKEIILQTYDTIIIDEAQFFSDLKECVIKWVDKIGLNVILSGLDGDFSRNPIGNILELIPYSDECIKYNSLCNLCKDGTNAPFTFRKVKSNDSILIGGSESYIPLCRKHYIEKMGLM